MANGINTDIFQPGRRERSRQNLYDAILGQQQDPDDYTIDEPEEPEMDEERRQQLQRLSSVSAIASGVDALTDAIGVGTSDSYAPAPTGIGELGVTSFNELSRMDQQHRERMNQWQQNVLETNRYNQQARRQVGQQNAQVDLQAAEQRYQDYANDAEANRQAEQAKAELEQQSDMNDQQVWREAGMRLISQGQEEAGVAALSQGGLSTQQITGMLQEGGTGGTDPETETRRNMVQRHQELSEQVEGNETQHYTAEGDPQSRQARQLEWIEEQMGQDLYNPLYQPGEQTDGDDSGDPTADMISPANLRRSAGGLDQEGVRQGLDSPGSIAHRNRELVQQIRNSSSQGQRRQFAEELVQNWQELGMNQQQIEQGMERLFGNEEEQQSESNTITDRQRSIYE